jgi:alkylated DNA repair dioxygenase AlkB
MNSRSARIFALAILMVTGLALPVFAEQPTIAERVTALKTNLVISALALQQYEWVETTVVSVDGEEKSRKQEQCYFGADGKVQKVLLNQSAPEAKKPGLRGLIQEKRQEERTEYQQEAVSVVRQYFPPDPARIQAAKDAGNLSVNLLVPGQSARLIFVNYYKAGDNLALDVDLTSNRPLAVNVTSYLDSDKEPVTLAVTFGSLMDGTTYPSGAVLDAKEKKLNVTLTNSGYRKAVR